MVGAAVIFLQTSCALPQAILLWRGRDILPERPFSLGRYGFAINLIAVIWVALLDILSCFPTEMPVTKENMNYVSVVSVGLTGIVLALYLFAKRGKYLGPRMPNELNRGDIYQVSEGQGFDDGAWADHSESLSKKE